MKSVRNYLVSLDSFGEPISVNYKGETSFKTCLGALATIALKTFVLIYASVMLLELAEYKDPDITQYTVYEPRTDGEEINFGEGLGTLGFSFQNVVT